MTNDFFAELSASSTPQIKVVEVTGDLDEANIDKLKLVVEPLLDQPELDQIVLDFSKLRFINSKGIGYLVSIHTHVTKDTKILAIASANEAVMDVISLVGLTSIIPNYTSVEEAMTVKQ